MAFYPQVLGVIREAKGGDFTEMVQAIIYHPFEISICGA